MTDMDPKLVSAIDKVLKEAGLELAVEDRAGVLKVLHEKFSDGMLETLFTGDLSEEHVRRSIIRLRRSEQIIEKHNRMAHSVLSHIHSQTDFDYFNGYALEELDANYFGGFYDFRIFQRDRKEYGCFGKKANRHLTRAGEIWDIARQDHEHVSFRVARAGWVYYGLFDLGEHFGKGDTYLLDLANKMASHAYSACPETSRDFDQIEGIYREVHNKWCDARQPKRTDK